jgi:hypothetical protein
MQIMEFGENVTLLAAVVGALLPGVVAWVNRAEWTAEAKGIVAAAASLLVGAASAFVAGQFNGADITRSVLIVFFLSQAAYKLYWKPTHLADHLERAGGSGD